MSYTIDLQKIADELDFDLEDVEMLFDVFLESAQESLQDLKNAIDSNDLEAIYSSSHTIKGSAANLTLSEIADYAKEMEGNAKDGNDFDYQSGFSKLKSLIESLRA